MGASRKKRWMGLALLVVLVAPVALYAMLSMGIPLADIRPTGLVASPSAKLWFQRVLHAHGGVARWQQIQEARYHMTAIFPNLVFRHVMGPFQENQVDLRWRYTPHQRLPLQIEAKYQTHDAALYRLTKAGSERLRGKVRTREPWRFSFFARSIRHLLDFPFLMKSADVVLWAGEATWKGQRYARIYMTWGKASPHPRVDQYLLWVNQKTHLIDKFDCTGRAVMPIIPSPFLQARVEFRAYRRRDGFQVPSSIKVFRGPVSQELAHSYAIHSATFRMNPAPRVPAAAR